MNHNRATAIGRPAARPGRPWAGTPRALLLAATLLCAAPAAMAGDCLLSATSLNFGSYDPISGTGPLDSNGMVQVSCDATTLGEAIFGVQVAISLNQGSSGSFAARTMRQAPDSILQYNLYTSAARATVWGNGSGGTQTVGGTVGGIFTGQPTTRSFPVYGRVPAGQDPRLGLHSDLVTVTVVF